MLSDARYRVDDSIFGTLHTRSGDLTPRNHRTLPPYSASPARLSASRTRHLTRQGQCIAGTRAPCVAITSHLCSPGQDFRASQELCSEQTHWAPAPSLDFMHEGKIRKRERRQFYSIRFNVIVDLKEARPEPSHRDRQRSDRAMVATVTLMWDPPVKLKERVFRRGCVACGVLRYTS